ncbi:MAG: hypothetical protein GY928_10420 [Colwellia sp.]|nr:hypothetical protein [Colwellia sp.]
MIKEVSVPVERIVNVNKEKLILRPHRTEVVTHEQIMEKTVPVDKYIDKRVEYEVPVYVEKEYERIVEVPETVYVDKPYDVEKVIDKKVEVFYDKVIEVPK